MADDRAERIAVIEAAFRIANERMAGWEEASGDAPELWFCECAELGCREKVALTRTAYEAVRARPEWFVIVPGHEVDDLETVIERREGHLVIEKPDAVMPIVRGTDPRAETPGPGRDQAQELAEGIAPEMPPEPES
jgi:hypothetical protein